jgi:hypothetical protein
MTDQALQGPLPHATPLPGVVVDLGDYTDFRLVVLPIEERDLGSGSYGYNQRGPTNPLSLHHEEVVLQTLLLPCLVRVPAPPAPPPYGTGMSGPTPAPTVLIVNQLGLVVARRINHPHLALRERLQERLRELEGFAVLLDQLRAERADLQRQVAMLRAAIPEDRLAKIDHDLARQAKKETP